MSMSSDGSYAQHELLGNFLLTMSVFVERETLGAVKLFLQGSAD
jgi:hypothetical protein